MLFRRRAPLLRGALVAGTGYMAGRSVARRQQAEYEQDAAIADLREERLDRPAPVAPPAAAPAVPSVVDELSRLGNLKSQGLISDEEFAAAKAKLLGS